MKKIDLFTILILILAGLVLGVRGIFGADLLGKMFFSSKSIVPRIIDIVFGAAAVYQLLCWKRLQKRFN